MLARLSRWLPLLTGGLNDSTARQQTLQDAIGWSYDLLTAEEQRLFRWLAVFEGGWTLEAAEAVANTEGARFRGVLDTLESLIGKSLISSEVHAGGPRFSMLETIRKYALERLVASGEEEAVRNMHGDYFLAVIDGTQRYASDQTPDAAIRRLRAEYANLRAAVRWGLLHRESHWALQFVWGLERFFTGRGNTTEGGVWLAGWLQDLLTITASDPRLSGWALHGAGTAATERGDFAAAHERFDQVIAFVVSSGNRALVASTRYRMVVLAQAERDFVAARAHAEECLAIRREIGTPWAVTVALAMVGESALAQRDFRVARACLEEGLAIACAIANTLLIAELSDALGRVASNEGEYIEAERRFAESPACYRSLGHPVRMARCLDALADVMLRKGDAACAARLLGAAAELREAIPIRLPEVDRPAVERTITQTRALLGDQAWRAAWSAGRDMPLEQIVAKTSMAATVIAP